MEVNFHMNDDRHASSKEAEKDGWRNRKKDFVQGMWEFRNLGVALRLAGSLVSITTVGEVSALIRVLDV